MDQKVAVIAGAGPGLGRALCQTFLAKGYTTIALSRGKVPVIRKLKNSGNHNEIVKMQCDLTVDQQLKDAIELIQKCYGTITVYVHNAHYLYSESVLRTPVADFELAWKTIARSAFVGVQTVLPQMLAQRRGTILLTGATASLRGGLKFSSFSSAKFALRGLAQSIAREYSEQGIHCAHVILDGLISSNIRSQAQDNNHQTDFLDPKAIAQQYLMLVNQPRSAWSHEIDLRPANEKF